MLLSGHKRHTLSKEVTVAGILWAIISVLVVLWLLGFLLHFGGSLIHLILVIVVVLVVINLLTGRGARV
jgi:CDP-diglyceride synthetase